MLLDNKFREFLKCISVHYIWDKRHVRHSMVGNILLKFILKINFIPCHTQELFIIISNVQKKTCSPWWKERKSFYLKLFMHNLSSSLSSHNWTNIYEKGTFPSCFRFIIIIIMVYDRDDEIYSETYKVSSCF